MKLNQFIRPDSLSEAHAALRELGPKGMALAGGTALHFMQTKASVAAVDITRLGLSFIRKEGDFFAIGATTPLSDIQRYRAPNWAMHEICRRISTHQIRNVSTIGGNICRVFPWADMPVVLLAMNARMVIHSGKNKETEVEADEYFSAQPARYFRDGEILTAVKVPVLRAKHGFGSVKASRNAAAFSLVTACAMLELKDGHIKTARVSAGSAIPFPHRLPSVEAALVGKEAVPAVFREAAAKSAADAKWCVREGLGEDYMRQLAEVSIVDALDRAATFAKGRSA
jgi:carbon-monoxide dehydrogenase medium subunit